MARRKTGKGRKPTVRNLKMSGPMTREERKKVDKANVEDVEWEKEELLVLGGRRDVEPGDQEPEGKWVFTRDPYLEKKGQKW